MKIRAVIGWIAGILLVASSVAHALLGWPALRASLEQANADSELMLTAKIGWLFGSVAMLTFGVIVLVVAYRMSQRMEVDRAPALVIGVCYAGFGLIAFLGTDLNPHFLGFILIGLLVVVTSAGRRRRRT